MDNGPGQFLGSGTVSWVPIDYAVGFHTQERKKDSNESVMTRKKFTLPGLKLVYTM